MKKLFWKLVKWAVDKFLQKKIDGDKPAPPPVTPPKPLGTSPLRPEGPVERRDFTARR